jgi:hypothetical protein
MFSVLRVLPRTSELDSTKDLEAKMNHIRPGVCAPMRRVGGGFSCEICDDLRWTHHKQELMRFLEEFVSVTSRFSAPNVSVVMDVAVSARDWESGANWLSVYSEPEFLAVLSRLGIALEFTYYSRQGERSPKESV